VPRTHATLVAAAILLLPSAAGAQKAGGTLRVPLTGNPPSLSIHEESTVMTIFPMMSVMSNLVIYDQHEPQNRLDNIRPDLAESWSWSDEGTNLTFKLRRNVTWHDGKPFSSADVKCTWDMLQGKSETHKLRRNPREIWYHNVNEVVADDPNTVTFRLKRPQPALLALLASGQSPVYPCHVSPADMRTKPIGTGPFKLVGYQQNSGITLERNEGYFKEGLPYLDGINFQIIPSRSTRHLSFIAGEHDITFPTDVTVPTMADLKAQAPQAQCTTRLSNTASNLLLNRDAPPFDNPELRRAVGLTLDRAAFNTIMAEGHGAIGGAMLPPSDGQWGLPQHILDEIPGYGGDIEKNREQARAIMEGLGYTAANPLKINVITRNTPSYRDPSVILLDQLGKIHIAAELEIIESAIYYNTITSKRFTIAMNVTGSAVDDPDQHFYENYACDSIRNYTGYCNREVEALFDEQSSTADQEKRRSIVWAIDRKLQEDMARPTLYHSVAMGCWHPHVQNYTIQVNSIYNGWRFEDLWLDQ